MHGSILLQDLNSNVKVLVSERPCLRGKNLGRQRKVQDLHDKLPGYSYTLAYTLVTYMGLYHLYRVPPTLTPSQLTWASPICTESPLLLHPRNIYGPLAPVQSPPYSSYNKAIYFTYDSVGLY